MWFQRLIALGSTLALTCAAPGGGTPENALLILDPVNLDSLYVANYYKAARAIPDVNLLYMQPAAASYAEFAATNLDGLFGHVSQAGIADHIDYIITLPGAPFFVPAAGLISDGCSPVTRFSISGAYTTAFIADRVLAGGLASNELNRYSRVSSDEARGFDSSTAWLMGAPTTSTSGRRYFIGALLGYSGPRGNTVAETLDLIDRSVAADGTMPAGTFYYMNNTADPARNVRASQYSAAINALQSLSGAATLLSGVLPDGRQDCLGIMTGAATLPILSADLTLRPGAFCDHLTSYAATFDEGSQTKLSEWISRGASGSWGQVEEPCNATFKFPHARFHVYYFQGMSLGESAFRSVGAVPFQGLLYGDPLTRPFARLPVVSLATPPGGPVSGVLTLSPAAASPRAGAAISGLELLIDGVVRATAPPGAPFVLNTAGLPDGWHDLRILAYDDTLVRSVGRWTGELRSLNYGRSVMLSATRLTGALADEYAFTVTAAGAAAGEVRLLHNGRVVAAGAGGAATLRLHGYTFGPGPVVVTAEALFADGMPVRSEPVELDISPTPAVSGTAQPTAFSYRKTLRAATTAVVELPAAYDRPGSDLSWAVLSPPMRATLAAGTPQGYRIVRPDAGACGADAMTFRVSGPTGDSNVATVNLFYRCRGDVNCDGAVDFNDIDAFILALLGEAQYFAAHPGCTIDLADADCNGVVNFDDIGPFVGCLTTGACPSCP